MTYCPGNEVNPTIKGGVLVETLIFYVATDGDDRWSGMLASANKSGDDGPFASLARARDAVRETRRNLTDRQAVTIMVRGGKYFLNQQLVLDARDSGSREYPVTYTAYPGEKPILSGGREVTDWEPYEGRIMRSSLPAAKGGGSKSRQLFFNGKRQIRARYPNFDPDNPLYGGWAYMESPADDGNISAYRFPEGTGANLYMRPSIEGGNATSFHYKPGTFERSWAKPRQGEVNCFFFSGITNDIVPIESVDEENRIIKLTREIWQNDRPPWYLAFCFYRNNRFIVENLLEELDEPGEWCLDSEDGILYFWPPAGIEDGEVIVPFNDCLISLRGASWITVSGFTLTETLDAGDDLCRAGGDGYGAMYPRQGRSYCGEALHMRRCQHCSIERNRFYAVGGNAIYLEGDNFRNRIQLNEIEYAGANGICLVGSTLQNPRFNRVEDNHIHHVGVFQKFGVGVYLAASDGNVVGHNHIHHVPHHAVNLGSNGSGRNYVEYNFIQHTALENHDSTAINCWGDVPMSAPKPDSERCGHVIRHNYIADTWGCLVVEQDDSVTIEAPTVVLTHAIYLDDFASNCLVYGNIIVRAGVGIQIHSGKNNLVENNIFAGCDYPIRYWNNAAGRIANKPMAGFMTGNRFCRNIVYTVQPTGGLIDTGNGWTDEVVQESDDNLFFDPDGERYYVTMIERAPQESEKYSLPANVAKKQLSLAEWRTMGYDLRSVVADPLVVDPEQDDFRLRLGSPAYKLGFLPINMDGIGIRTDESGQAITEDSHYLRSIRQVAEGEVQAT